MPRGGADSERRKRLRELFDAAMDLDPSERSSFIARSCEGESGLQSALESLVNHSLGTGSDFDRAVNEVIDLEDSIRTSLDILGRTFGNYRVIEKIGEGGMGEVYRATDSRLGRDVAIKILPEAFAGDPERLARFEREARVLASLNHPNIATIHGIEESEGIRFLVLELVEGVTLRDKLGGGDLATKNLVRLATQVAEGLAKAHAVGVVHRDLKPENLMLTDDGHVKILDFGLAKATEKPAAPSAGDVRTETGRVMGTTSYMSPEQARGDEVDHRSDQFSFGSVLFEMATGSRAFGGSSAADTLVAIMRDEPERPPGFDALVPPPLRWIIERCLAKEPAGRYESTRDLARDLRDVTERLREISDSASAPRATADALATTRGTRPGAGRGRRPPVVLRIAGAIVVTAVLAGVLLGPRVRGPTAPAGPELDPNRVVVVPFENRTGESDNEVIGLMIADWLTQGVPENAGVTFAAGSSAVAAARRFGGSQGSPLDVAREVGAGTAIAGAYYRHGDQLQIKAEVVAANSGELLHGVEPVSGPISEPMSVVEPLRQTVLGLLAGRDPVISRFIPPTFEAYREFVIARDIWIEHPDAALEHFQRSLELDPGFLPAQLYSVHPLIHLGRREEARSILDGLDARREELNPYERLFLDSIRLYYERRYAEALPVLRDIVARDPLNPHLRSGHGQVARWTNRPQEAVTTLEAQGDWHELGFPQLYSLCDALHMLGQHRRELEVARHAVVSFPREMSTVISEARALAALGRIDDVAKLVEESSPGSETSQIRLAREVSLELRVHGSTKAAREMAEKTLARYSANEGLTPRARWYLATLMWVAERPEDARTNFADLAAEHPDDATFVGSLGMVAAHLGDRDAAQVVSRRLAFEELENPQFVGEEHYRLACIAAGLGNLEEAVEHLHAALKAGARFSPEFHRDPFLDPLRGFGPFEEFLRPKG